MLPLLRRAGDPAVWHLPDGGGRPGRRSQAPGGGGMRAGQGELLTVEEAAAYLRISRDLAYELCRRRELPHLRLGRVIRVPRQGLEVWIAQKAGLATAPPEGVCSLPKGAERP